MKDYTATITLSWGFQAKGEEQAEERASKMLEAVTLQFLTPTGKPAVSPVWLGDMEDTEVQVDEV